MPETRPDRSSRRGRGHGGPPMMGQTEKPKDFKGALKALLGYIGKYRLAVLFVLLFALLASVLSIVGPKILGNITTLLFEGIMGNVAGTGEGIDWTGITNTIGLIILIYAASSLFQLIQGWVMATVANTVCYNLRRDVELKTNVLPLNYYDQNQTGDVLSRITNDVDNINQGINQSLTQIITSIATILGVIVMMLSISWAMTLISLLSLPVSALFIMLIVKKSQQHFVKQQQGLADVNAAVEENYGALQVVEAFGKEDEALKLFNQCNNKLFDAAWRANFLSGLMFPITNIVANISYVAFCILGGWLASQGAISVGDIQAAIQYSRQISMPVTQLAQISASLQTTLAAAERIFTFLKLEPESEAAKVALDSTRDDQASGIRTSDSKLALAEVPENQRSIEFQHVHFSYLPNKPVINDFSANIKPGQHIAIVGPTGAGKTTIVKLLMRFYDLDSGTIKLGGRDITAFNKFEVRRSFGMVLQDSVLFSDTIANNIRYGKMEATDAEVQRAAEIASADTFIKTLPDGYNMMITEEANNLSTGQKQLITIARAVLQDPNVLILDEATSSVDTRTERLIQSAMNQLMQQRTSFIIAHRLSTITGADLILVMDHGDIIEQGTHQELLDRGGFYAKLYGAAAGA